MLLWDECLKQSSDAKIGRATFVGGGGAGVINFYFGGEGGGSLNFKLEIKTA